MQIAVEVTKDINLNIFSEKDKTKVVDVNLGCRDSDQSHQYRLFVTSKSTVCLLFCLQFFVYNFLFTFCQHSSVMVPTKPLLDTIGI